MEKKMEHELEIGIRKGMMGFRGVKAGGWLQKDFGGLGFGLLRRLGLVGLGFGIWGFGFVGFGGAYVGVYGVSRFSRKGESNGNAVEAVMV